MEKVKGYRDLSHEEIVLINEIKSKGEEIGALVDKLVVLNSGTIGRMEDKPDMRWVSIAKTHLQQGFMALVRSVAKPENF